MGWEVFGDVAFLEIILNAIAAMFSPFRTGTGSNEYSGMVSAAALIGALLIIATSVIMGTGNPARKLIVSLTVFLIAFSPSTSVTMVSNQTGATRTVQNIPISIAFTGMLFSRIGTSMTALFESAYSVPATTQHGFVDGLHAWRTLRSLTSTPEAWTAANNVGGGDFGTSWKNYVSDCTARAIESGQLTIDTVRQSALVQTGLAVANQTMTTLINVGSGFVLRDCRAAYTALMSYSNSQVVPAVRGLLQQYFTKPGSISTTSFSDRLAEMVIPMRLAAHTENDLVLSFMIASLYEQGIAQRHILDGRQTYAQVIYDAVRQRNVQWSAQGDLFSHYVQPVLTFVEGFFYATFPLILVLLVLSVNGFGVLTKFLALGLWIQFWFPIASIVHLFTYMSVESSIDDIIAAGVPPASFAGIAMAEGVVDKWLSVSGLFASAIPVLALFLITGSVYAFQGLASSVGSPDTISEKNAEPDTYAAAPVTQGLPRFEESALRGRVSPGSVETLPSYTLAHDTSTSVRSAERQSEGAREAFVEATSKVFSTTSGSRSSSDASSAFRESISTQESTTQQFMQGEGSSFVRRFAEQHGISDQEARNFALNAGLGVQTPGVGRVVGGNAGGKVGRNESQTSSSSRNNEIQTAMNRQVSENETFANGLTESIARDFSRVNTNSSFSVSQSTSAQELRQSAEQYVAADRSYEEAVADQRSVGAQQRLDTPFLAQQIASDPRQYEDMTRMMAQNRLLGEATTMAQRWITAGHFGSDADGQRQAMVGASLAVMDRHGMNDALSNVLRPWGLYVPDIGSPEPIQGTAPAISAGASGESLATSGASSGTASGNTSTRSIGRGSAPSGGTNWGGVTPPALPPSPDSIGGQEVFERFLDNDQHFVGPQKRAEFNAELARDRADRVAAEEPSYLDQAQTAIERNTPDGLLAGSPQNRYDTARELGVPEPLAEYYREESRDPGSAAAQAARRDVLIGADGVEGRAVAEEALTNLEAAAARAPNQAEIFVRRAATIED